MIVPDQLIIFIHSTFLKGRFDICIQRFDLELNLTSKRLSFPLFGGARPFVDFRENVHWMPFRGSLKLVSFPGGRRLTGTVAALNLCCCGPFV